MAGPWMVWSILLPALLAAAPPPADPLQQEWRWTRFDEEDGLPGGAVLALEEGRDGPVWVGTEMGVAWYDGWRWHPVPLPGVAFPVQDLSVAIEESGAIWVVAGGSVQRGDRTGFRRMPFPESSTPESVALLPEGGALVVARQPEGGVSLLRVEDGGAHRVEVPPGVEADPRLQLYRSPSERLWGLSVAGAFLWEQGRWVNPFPPEVVARGAPPLIAENATGDLVLYLPGFSGARGVWEWSAGGLPRRVRFDGNLHPSSLAMSFTSEVVACRRLSGELFRRREGIWEEFDRAHPAFQEARLLRFRSNGDLWCGTGQGLLLNRASSRLWETWDHPQDTHDARRIHEILQAEDGTFWLASSNRLEARSPTGVVLPRTPEDSPECREITALAEGPDGEIWAGSGSAFSGLRCWNWKTRQWRSIRTDVTGTPLGLIHKIRCDQNGGLWLLSLSTDPDHRLGFMGAIHRVRDGRIEPWVPARELTERRFYDLDEGRDGSLWFATHGGASRWRAGRWRHWTAQDHPLLKNVSSIAADPEGGAWTGHSRAGCVRIEPDCSVHQVEFSDGRELPGVWDMAFDHRGWLWVTTEVGLLCRADGEWSLLDRDSGLVIPRLWPVLPLADRILVGSLGAGLWILDLKSAASLRPRVFLDPVEIRGDDVEVSWRVAARWGGIPSRGITTRFRLDGNEWSPWSRTRRTQLSGLAPGDHVVEVQALGLLGHREDGRRTEIRIQQPLPLRAWFLIPAGIFLVLLITGMAGLLIRSRRATEALRISERRYRRLVEEAANAIVIADLEGRILQVNRRAVRLFQRSREELSGRTLWDLMLVSTDGRTPESTGESLVERRSVRCPDGSIIPVELSLVILGDRRIMANLWDLSEQQRLAEERISFERKLADTQRLESLGVLAGGVAHDFNNLLTAILGHAEGAREHLPADSEAAEHLRQVVVASEQAADLTRQLLTSAGQSSFERILIRVNELIREMRSLLTSSVGKGTRLTIDLGPEDPVILGDPGRIRQVLLNLIVNSSEAIGSSEGEIRVTSGTGGRTTPALAAFGSELPRGEQWVWITVRDDGPGMTPEVLARVFEPFFTTKFAGRGLGLPAVRGIVTAHDGRIRIDPVPTGGMIFTVVLPATDPVKASVRVTPTADRWTGSGTILLVDDEEYIRRLVIGQLRHLGFGSLVASRGEEGLELFQEHRSRVVGALLDYTMPGWNGLELLDRLRRIRPDLPAVIMSGWDQQAVLSTLEGDEGTVFLQKPFDLQRLAGALRTSLEGG